MPGLPGWRELATGKPAQLAVPIQDQQCYALILSGPKNNYTDYTDSEVDFLLAVAAQAAIVLANIELYQKALTAERSLERSQRLAALGTLTAGLAHELKNPLAAISNMTSLLPQRLRSQAFMQKFSEIVPRQIQRIELLLGGMLNLSKTSASKTELVELAKVWQRVQELLVAAARRQNVELTSEIDSVGKVLGDEKKLEQVFLNIGLNALESMAQGGNLIFRIIKQQKGVLVEIEDTGCGIAKQNLAKIFDPFYTTKKSGTGLGLAISYRILEQHQAQINVESKRGRGTKFKIFLPHPVRQKRTPLSRLGEGNLARL